MIDLKKWQTISLKKESNSKIQFWVNWGQIKGGNGWFLWSLFGSDETVDLDASVVLLDKNKDVIETVSFQNLRTAGVSHSWDDTTGDSSQDDNDNEIITVETKDLDKEVESLVFFINSYKHQDFKDIPYAHIRMKSNDNVIAKYNIWNNPEFAGSIAMILWKFDRNGWEWNFTALWKPTQDWSINSCINTIKETI